jgi:uncharacterized protein YciU (UPF0263 family)
MEVNNVPHNFIITFFYFIIPKMCSENGDQVPFGEDNYYEQIVKDDFRGYDFIKQRESWREGTDFSFKAEFFAEEDAPTIEEQEELELDDMLGTTAVDTTAEVIVDADAKA